MTDGWRDLLEEQGDELNELYRTPTQRYKLAQYLEDKLEALFYFEEDWDFGVAVLLVGFTAKAQDFLKINPDDITIVQGAVSKKAVADVVERECELRFRPEDVQIVAVGCEDESKCLPVRRRRK